MTDNEKLYCAFICADIMDSFLSEISEFQMKHEFKLHFKRISASSKKLISLADRHFSLSSAECFGNIAEEMREILEQEIKNKTNHL